MIMYGEVDLLWKETCLDLLPHSEGNKHIYECLSIAERDRRHPGNIVNWPVFQLRYELRTFEIKVYALPLTLFRV